MLPLRRFFVPSLLLLSACLPRERLNSRCAFADSARPLDLSISADRRHLRTDAQIAEELGIRQGDATRGRESMTARAARREGCTGALFDQIVRLHGVSKSDIAAAALERDWLIDALLVFLPVCALMFGGCVALADRLNGRFADEERATWWVMAILAALVFSLLTMFVGEMWSWLVEMVRNDDMHISFRAFRLPWASHRWLIYAVSVVAFVGVVYGRARKTRPIFPS